MIGLVVADRCHHQRQAVGQRLAHRVVAPVRDHRRGAGEQRQLRHPGAHEDVRREGADHVGRRHHHALHVQRGERLDGRAKKRSPSCQLRVPSDTRTRGRASSSHSHGNGVGSGRAVIDGPTKAVCGGTAMSPTSSDGREGEQEVRREPRVDVGRVVGREPGRHEEGADLVLHPVTDLAHRGQWIGQLGGGRGRRGPGQPAELGRRRRRPVPAGRRPGRRARNASTAAWVPASIVSASGISTSRHRKRSAAGPRRPADRSTTALEHGGRHRVGDRQEPGVGADQVGHHLGMAGPRHGVAPRRQLAADRHGGVHVPGQRRHHEQEASHVRRPQPSPAPRRLGAMRSSGARGRRSHAPLELGLVEVDVRLVLLAFALLLPDRHLGGAGHDLLAGAQAGEPVVDHRAHRAGRLEQHRVGAVDEQVHLQAGQQRLEVAGPLDGVGVLAVDRHRRQVEPAQGVGRQRPGRSQVLDDRRLVDERLGLAGQPVELAAAELVEPLLHVLLAQAEAGQLEVVRPCGRPTRPRRSGPRRAPGRPPGRGGPGPRSRAIVPPKLLPSEVDRLGRCRARRAAPIEVGDRCRRSCSRRRGARCGRGPAGRTGTTSAAPAPGGGEREVEARQVVDDAVPWSMHHGRRASGRPRRWSWNRRPLTVDLRHGAVDRRGRRAGAAAVVGQAGGDEVDELADGQVDDLVEVQLAEPADEVDLLAVALELELLGESHELDALELEVLVERACRP